MPRCVVVVSNPDGWLDTGTGIFTVPFEGIYFISGAFVLKFYNLHNEHGYIQVNNGQLVSTPTVTRHPDAPGNFEFCAVQGMMRLAAEQTVTFQALHLAGAGNIMEVTGGDGVHAGLWLIDRV